MSVEMRRVGLEQEFFLVDEAGVLSDRSDEFLALCRERAEDSGRAPSSFLLECARHMVEEKTSPASLFD